MEKNSDITITQVTNGWIIMDTIGDGLETVCQTKAELLRFITNHFTYRQDSVWTDRIERK